MIDTHTALWVDDSTGASTSTLRYLAYRKNVLALRVDEVFVFGSNLRGIHGAGAAATARKRFGAKLGRAEGVADDNHRTYAIPTKTSPWGKALPLDSIEASLLRLAEHILISSQQGRKYFITPIGCGLAGHHSSDVAPIVRKIFLKPTFANTVIFPYSFISTFVPSEAIRFYEPLQP